MPNWVMNKVRCVKLKEIKERYADEEHDMVFSFVKVIPHPGDWSLLWAVENWGTKWNAGDPEFIEGEDPLLTFKTAWSMPEGIYRALAKQLGCEIDVEYADEDWGYNCGHAIFYPDGSEWFKDMELDPDYAAKLWGEKGYVEYMRESGDYSEEEIEECLEYWADKRKEAEQ